MSILMKEQSMLSGNLMKKELCLCCSSSKRATYPMFR
ncbi:heterogeneous nuclear ribonucleoprotein R, isoform CRA_b [Rattus norvegicus]|uniref:Heterogeneous nuclear ribonucleoprotein R, isoform CRA_b n=1 Tax=Rattus norvegicus TaxID=10116 RepID=A6ITB0_RAT|nr:heterogeneous nuclear ribonucleoprotein R, isoform CRA_b [Rattus norvegicus]